MDMIVYFLFQTSNKHNIPRKINFIVAPHKIAFYQSNSGKKNELIRLKSCKVLKKIDGKVRIHFNVDNTDGLPTLQFTTFHKGEFRKIETMGFPKFSSSNEVVTYYDHGKIEPGESNIIAPK